jgi:ribonuclease P/MRP protein subunit POP5
VSVPKHLRPRWRYLAVGLETWPDARPTRRAFQSAVWSAGRSLLGDPGSARADLSVVDFRFSAGAGSALVRTRHDEVDPARAALACVEVVDGNPVGLWVMGVSGTIRTCKESYLREPPEPTNTAVAFDGVSRSALVREDAVDIRDGDTFTGATPLDVEED